MGSPNSSAPLHTAAVSQGNSVVADPWSVSTHASMMEGTIRTQKNSWEPVALAYRDNDAHEITDRRVQHRVHKIDIHSEDEELAYLLHDFGVWHLGSKTCWSICPHLITAGELRQTPIFPVSDMISGISFVWSIVVAMSSSNCRGDKSFGLAGLIRRLTTEILTDCARACDKASLVLRLRAI